VAVSKRTRYEVLRRDNFTCRYCGGSAPDVKLTVDHVVPITLGGSDEPNNLVAACADCNAGKSSTTPDAALVDDVAADAERWSRAIRRVAEQRTAEAAAAETRLAPFRDAWLEWDHTGSLLPMDWKPTVEGWLKSGLTIEEAIDAMDIAVGNRSVRHDGVFPYTCGVVRNKLRALHDAARALLEQGEA
jgi:hypothetical protein